MTQHIDVVAAVIVLDGRVLCARRGPGRLEGKWEFPGGKIEPGETPKGALAREVAEELGVVIVVGERVETTHYEYTFGSIVLQTFRCTLAAGAPAAREHTSIAWKLPRELTLLDWAPADIPAVRSIAGV